MFLGTTKFGGTKKLGGTAPECPPVATRRSVGRIGLVVRSIGRGLQHEHSFSQWDA